MSVLARKYRGKKNGPSGGIPTYPPREATEIDGIFRQHDEVVNALKAENARLRKALEDCLRALESEEVQWDGFSGWKREIRLARQALSDKSDPNLASSHTTACNVRFQRDEENLKTGKCTCSDKSE